MVHVQVRLCAVIFLSLMFAGCGSLSSTQPGSNQPAGSPPPGPNPTPTGATFVAADFPGADCGAKIRAADAAAGSQSATIDVTAACGTAWTTQVVIGPSHTLLVEDATYQMTKTVLLHDGACVLGQNATLLVTKPVDIISNADVANSNLCVKTITLSAAGLTGGISRGVYFKNVNGFTISGVNLESMVTHGVFIDDGGNNGQIVNNVCHGVIQGSCFLAGNSPGLATVSNINISNNQASSVNAGNGIFVIGIKNGQPTSHITINNNVFQCIRDTSVEIGDGAQFITASGNQITTCAAGSTGIIVRSAQHIVVQNNSCSPAPAAANMIGIFIWNHQGDFGPFQDITVNQNTVTGFTGAGSSGISWSSFLNTSQDLFITNNTVTGNLHGLFARTNNITNLVLSGNVD